MALSLIVDDREYERVFFHVRAYFWELYCVWDYLLQHANASTLKWKPHLVKGDNTGDFLSKIELEHSNYAHLNVLRQIQSNAVFQKVKKMRNYAHKWHYNPVLSMATDGPPSVGNPARSIMINNSDKKEPGLPAQVFVERNDLEFFKETVEQLTNLGFFV